MKTPPYQDAPASSRTWGRWRGSGMKIWILSSPWNLQRSHRIPRWLHTWKSTSPKKRHCPQQRGLLADPFSSVAVLGWRGCQVHSPSMPLLCFPAVFWLTAQSWWSWQVFSFVGQPTLMIDKCAHFDTFSINPTTLCTSHKWVLSMFASVHDNSLEWKKSIAFLPHYPYWI